MKQWMGCADCQVWQVPAYWLDVVPGLVWHLMKRHMDECNG